MPPRSGHSPLILGAGHQLRTQRLGQGWEGMLSPQDNEGLRGPFSTPAAKETDLYLTPNYDFTFPATE